MEKLRVLLVDDEKELVTTLKERLVLRNIEADSVITGAEALEKIRETDFDIVLLDVKMPGMGGPEVMRRIKEIRPTARVILLTGSGSEKTRELGKAEGALDCLMKPINIENLIERMKEAVAG